MSAVTSWYPAVGEYLMKGELDLSTDDIKAILVNGYSPDYASHSVVGDITGEVSGAGYTTGGKSVAVTDISTVGGKTYLTASDLEWLSITVDATGVVLYDNTHADKPLIGYVDFGGTKSSSNSILRVKWGVNGMLGMQV